MFKKLRPQTLLASLFLMLGLSFSVVGVGHAATTDILCGGSSAATDSQLCDKTPGASEKGIFALIKTIINVLLTLGGSIAVIMIVIGGIRYVTSNGEQAHVKGAKDTILYAVVGLVVAILAFAIVNFVIAKL